MPYKSRSIFRTMIFRISCFNVAVVKQQIQIEIGPRPAHMWCRPRRNV